MIDGIELGRPGHDVNTVLRSQRDRHMPDFIVRKLYVSATCGSPQSSRRALAKRKFRTGNYGHQSANMKFGGRWEITRLVERADRARCFCCDLSPKIERLSIGAQSAAR